VEISRTGPEAFTVAFATEAELRSEHASNLSAGGLKLPTAEKVPLFTKLNLTLRLEGRGEATLVATTVARLPDGLALATEGDMNALLAKLLAAAEPAREPDEREQSTVWDRLRSLTRMEKIQLAAKAERTERALLVNDNDPQVLWSLLKNPRLTIDEVIRLAKSPFLTYQNAETIVKNVLWMANVDVRVTLIHNAKLPVPFALRILPTLPESEVRTISRGAATSMALKTAALKRLQGAS
jgi:hypothetical protein